MFLETEVKTVTEGCRYEKQLPVHHVSDSKISGSRIDSSYTKFKNWNNISRKAANRLSQNLMLIDLISV